MASTQHQPSPTTNSVDYFRGWADYPANLDGRDALTSSASLLSDRLTRLTKTLFACTVNLFMVGINPDGSITADSKVYDQAIEVERVLQQDASKRPRIRIISLHSKGTPFALQITEPLMRKVLTAYKVDPAFLHVLFSFGRIPHLAENGSRNFACNSTGDGSKDISYQIRYVEENKRSGSQPWSTRQTGIFHHHSAGQDFDFFIFLNPYPLEKCVVERQLLNLTKSPPAVRNLLEDPYRLHLLPFASYLDNWRWYFHYVGEEFSKTNDRVMTLELEQESVGLTFDEVLWLRDLEDIALTLTGHCKSALSTIKDLQKIPEARFEHQWTLQPYSDRLGDFIESLSALTARIKNTIDLAAYFLELKNQETATKTNENMSKLASETHKDTTAMKWITYLTVIYLPANFVATLYGMNLFDFNQADRQLVVSADFWIYVATWLPLTFVTLMGYKMLKACHEPESCKVSRWVTDSRSRWKLKLKRRRADEKV